MSINSNAVIYGLSSFELTEEEINFFSEANPLGFILFKRNIDNPQQVKDLVKSLKELVGWNCLILIDQEGGRVARLRPPHWKEFPAMEKFAKIAENDLEKAKEETFKNAVNLGETLIELGINVDCAPVCDLLFPDAHDIVGDRSFGLDVNIVTELARKTAEGLLSKKVLPIIKHIPGHGRAKADSHEDLPIVTTPLTELKITDFKVFENLSDIPWAMTAHIVYTSLDDKLPATLSSKVIDFIRNDIGFNGVLVSDDLSMHALKGSFEDRTENALKAGCDVVLHCNGDMNEMKAIASKVTKLSGEAIDRVLRSLDFI